MYGLIGYPLKNSFSKDYFNKKFDSSGTIDSSYENFPLEDLTLFPQFLDKHPEIKGLNITIPYKERIIPYLTSIDEKAKNIGAVNCVRINSDGSSEGFNTDAMALEIILKNLKKKHLIENALVLGNGGVAKAVCYVLDHLNIPFTVVCRNPKPPSIHFETLNAQQLTNHTIWINCTPLGMFPNVDSKPPIPYDLITKDHLLYDLIYLPEETQFLKLGKMKGATTINGLEMLLLQAEKSWEIWQDK